MGATKAPWKPNPEKTYRFTLVQIRAADTESREALKDAGFRWNRYDRCWWRQGFYPEVPGRKTFLIVRFGASFATCEAEAQEKGLAEVGDFKTHLWEGKWCETILRKFVGRWAVYAYCPADARADWVWAE